MKSQNPKQQIMKQQIYAIVECCEKNLSAYIQGIDGVIAVGKNINDLKDCMQRSILMYIESCVKDGIELEEVLKEDYEVVYRFDLASFLNIYGDVLSKSGLEVLTGINQKQLWHYAKGKRKPRKETVEKVCFSIHEFARELADIEFAY